MKLLIAATLFSSMTMASESNCSMQLNDDLIVNSNQVELKRGDESLWRINNQGALWIKGQVVDTDRATSANLQQYQAGLRDSAKDTVVLVADALEIANTAVTRVMEQFGVDTGDQRSKVNAALDKMRSNIDQVVYSHGDEIQIHGSKMDSLDNGFDKELSIAMEESMAEVTGNVLMMVGKAMAGGEGTFEQRMQAFETKMDKFGEDLDAEMQAKGDALEARGQLICNKLQTLDSLEQQIQAQVPQMADFDVIKVDNVEDSSVSLVF